MNLSCVHVCKYCPQSLDRANKKTAEVNQESPNTSVHDTVAGHTCNIQANSVTRHKPDDVSSRDALRGRRTASRIHKDNELLSVDLDRGPLAVVVAGHDVSCYVIVTRVDDGYVALRWLIHCSRIIPVSRLELDQHIYTCHALLR